MHAWQYNGVAPMQEILAWCEQCLNPLCWHHMGWETILFADDATYVMFKLRWSQ